MARHPKTKGGSTAQPKRRKKAGALGTGSSSPALSATSSSGSSLTAPGHQRECEQCGNNALLEGVARGASVKSKSAAASTGCQICDFVAYRRSQRPCVQCARTSCDHFCEWCGKGFHLKCARLRDEDVGNPNGFCCHKCEAEQSVDGHAMGTHDKDKGQAMGTDDDGDVGSRCGSCRLPFAMTGREGEDGKTAAGTGFKVNQAVLVDNDEVLYNAVITEVDAPSERIKIHFTRWSKSFDDWYAMEDEHINESLACDCCNNWFHIGCLPPIKSSGRWKDSTYVCPRCIDDARAFHNDSRAALKAKAANPPCVTSNAIAKALKKVTMPKEGEAGGAKTVKLGKASSGVLADGEEGAGEKKTGRQSEKRAETGRALKGPTKKKRKLTDMANSSSVKARSAESASERAAKNARRALSDSDAAMPAQPKEFVPAEAILKISLAPSEIGADSSNDHAALMDVSVQAKAKTSKAHITKANAAASMNASATMHMSPERTIKVASEAHSSPYKAAAAKIGASNEPAADDPNSDKHERKLTTSETSAPEQSKWHSSCNTVMSLLNSPSSSGTPTKAFKPTVTSLPMLNSADNQNGIITASPEPVMTMPANFQVYVKMEPNHGQFSLYPRPVLNGKSVQVSRKEAAAVSTKPTKAATARQTKQCQTGAGERNLSAFDILREVASQEIDEGAAFVKLKRERRLMGRGISTSTSKRTKMDVSTCPSNAAASPGRAGPPGVFSTPTVSDTSQSPQTRDRIQMNSFVDLHFSIRKEMYLRFCRLEEEGMLTRDTAHLLRSLIYPTSERFQDLRFVYLVNKDVPSIQLTKRLLEAVPYPPTGSKPIARTVPHASSSACGGRGTGGLPMSMKMFPAGLSCNPSPTGTSHMGLLPPPPGSTFLRLKPPQSDDNSGSSRLVSGNAVVSQPHSPRSSASPVSGSVNTTKRSEMMMMEHLAPTSRRPAVGREGATSQQQQQQQQLLNSR